MDAATSNVPHIVIIGGGFAGLWATRALRKARVRITLVDRTNHHLFQPLLYQVATAGLSSSDIAAPLRRILRKQANVEVRLATVDRIEPDERRVYLDAESSVTYDMLVVATGATHAYFGNDKWAPFAPGLKTLKDAVRIRRRILTAFERAEAEDDPAKRAAWLNFAIVGGGPTGVELAGTLAELAHHTLRHEFRHIDPASAKVRLLEAGPRVLATFPESLSEKARKQLVKLRVDVITGKPVTDITDDGYRLGDEFVAAKTVVWAAGVAASPLAKSLRVPLDRAGRVNVENDLTVPGRPEIFVAGDLASVAIDGKPVPGIAPAAKQMGNHVAHVILDRLEGKASTPFRYKDYGNLATIGRMAAVVDLRGFKFSGAIAWLFWLVAHIFFLIGFRNRLTVMINWLWAYTTYDRAARVVVGDTRVRDDSTHEFIP